MKNYNSIYYFKTDKEETKVEDLGLGPNPTAAMIAQKRRSIVAKSKLMSTSKTVKSNEAAISPKSFANKTSTTSIQKPEPKLDPDAQVLKPEPAMSLHQASSGLSAAKLKEPGLTKENSGKEKEMPSHLATPSTGFPGAEKCQIYIAQGKSTILPRH